MDIEGAADNFELIAEYIPPGFRLVSVSVERGEALEHLRRSVFDLLGIIRIYSKKPGHDPDTVSYTHLRLYGAALLANPMRILSGFKIAPHLARISEISDNFACI